MNAGSNEHRVKGTQELSLEMRPSPGGVSGLATAADLPVLDPSSGRSG